MWKIIVARHPLTKVAGALSTKVFGEHPLMSERVLLQSHPLRSAAHPPKALPLGFSTKFHFLLRFSLRFSIGDGWFTWLWLWAWLWLVTVAFGCGCGCDWLGDSCWPAGLRPKLLEAQGEELKAEVAGWI